MDEKRFRIDLFIAALALVISGVAAGTSAYQTYVIRKQLSSNIWPYVTFITTSSVDKYFELDVSNVGIGPALILGSVITRDGKVMRGGTGPTAMPAIAKAIAPERKQADALERKARERNETLTVSTLLPGDVVPPGEKLQMLRVDGKFLTDKVLSVAHRIDFTLCYCSLLGDCWTKRLWDPALEPHSVRSCPNA